MSPDTLDAMSERIAAELQEAIDALTRIREMVEEHRKVDEQRLNHLDSALRELVVPTGLSDALAAVGEGRRDYLKDLDELLEAPIAMLDGTLASLR